jgi:hypothetical protein
MEIKFRFCRAPQSIRMFVRTSSFKLTERYCVVYQTIRIGPPVEVMLRRS